MSEVVADVAAVAVKVAGKGLFSGLLAAAPWLPLAIAGVGVVGTLAGTGTAVWYRMEWKSCQAAGAQALIDQRQIDQRDNSVAVGALNAKLTTNENHYNNAVALLASIPKNDACLRDERVRSARDSLCSKYPTSEACTRPVPTRQVP